MATFVIVTNTTNGAGLQRDYELLRAELESYGHKVYGELHFGNPTYRDCDCVIFLEVIDPRWFTYAKHFWLAPNSEWWFERPWDQFLPKFEYILCKTLDCLRIWQKKVGAERCRYVGWMAEDLYDPTIPREPKFLHIAGKSETKNTFAVISAFSTAALAGYELTLVTVKHQFQSAAERLKNVRIFDRMIPLELKQAMNHHRYFLMPSMYEGYGMVLHEAQSCGAVILTTAVAPMNELKGLCLPIQIPTTRTEPMHAACYYHVQPAAIAVCVATAARLGACELEEISKSTRTGYLEEQAAFKQRFKPLVEAMV